MSCGPGARRRRPEPLAPPSGTLVSAHTGNAPSRNVLSLPLDPLRGFASRARKHLPPNNDRRDCAKARRSRCVPGPCEGACACYLHSRRSQGCISRCNQIQQRKGNVMKITTPIRFELGQIVSTPGALEACSQEHLRDCLLRHARGDWGCVCPEDAAQNDLSLNGRVSGSFGLSDRPGQTLQGLWRQHALDHYRSRPQRDHVPAAKRILSILGLCASAAPLLFSHHRERGISNEQHHPRPCARLPGHSFAAL